MEAGQDYRFNAYSHGNGLTAAQGDLAAQLELFDADGSLVSSASSRLVTGREPLLSFTPTTSGIYTVRVSADQGQGEYVLRMTLWDNRQLIGDVNGDGQFDSADLVAVFQAGEYEDAAFGNSMFGEGDWNGDGDFSTADLVLAFQMGGFVRNSLPELALRDKLIDSALEE